MKKGWKAAVPVLLLALLVSFACAEELDQQNGNGDLPARVDGYSFTLTASPIQYGMHLADSVLSAEGSTITLNGETVAAQSLGSFSWQDMAQVPYAGVQQCYAVFTPHEELGASFEAVPVSVQVNKARPEITSLPMATSLVYGQSLSQSILQGGAAHNPYNGALDSVQGVFEWELRDMVPSVGLQEATVVFTPIINAADLYETVYFSLQVNVEKMPTYLKEYPVPARALLYGESLEQMPLSGGYAEDEWGREVPGTYAFSDAAYVPGAGTHTAEVVFTPLDYAHRKEVRFSVQLTVEKTALAVSCEPVELVYGQTLADAAIRGSAQDALGREVPGSFVWQDGALMPSVAQSGQYAVTFTPDDKANYTACDTQVQVNVHKVQLYLTWSENGKYAGEEDRTMQYSVPGLPEGESLVGQTRRDAGESVGTYVIYADDLSLPPHLEENFLLIKENGVFTISAYQTDARATVSGDAGENGWYAGSATLQAPAGYQVSFSRDGAYAAALSLPESAQGADYYLKVTDGAHAGAVAGPVHASYQLDMTPPDIEISWQEGNEFTLSGHDALSGVDRIYGIFAGPAQYYEGAADVSYAYAARETGNYTYVIHDLAGHTATVALDFADTDGDGLVDVYELRSGTSPDLADTDGDGVGDFDSRRIRNLLGYDRLHVSSAALLGTLQDAGGDAPALPAESRGLLVRDELSAPRQYVYTGGGLMRQNATGMYGLTGDILWFESAEGMYSALHLEDVSGRVALSCHAPGGVIALCGYENEALQEIRVADLRTGAVMLVQESTGAERFDLSPDGKYLAYAKDGNITLIELETGLGEEIAAACGNVFCFDEDSCLVTEENVLVRDGEGWKQSDAKSDMSVRALAQPLRGECVLLIGTDEEMYLIRVAGSGKNVRGDAELVLCGACAPYEASVGASALDAALALPLGNKVTALPAEAE